MIAYHSTCSSDPPVPVQQLYNWQRSKAGLPWQAVSTSARRSTRRRRPQLPAAATTAWRTCSNFSTLQGAVLPAGTNSIKTFFRSILSNDLRVCETYFIRGSPTIWLISSLTTLDSEALLHKINMFIFAWLNPIKSVRNLCQQWLKICKKFPFITSWKKFYKLVPDIAASWWGSSTAWAVQTSVASKNCEHTSVAKRNSMKKTLINCC